MNRESPARRCMLHAAHAAQNTYKACKPRMYLLRGDPARSARRRRSSLCRQTSHRGVRSRLLTTRRLQSTQGVSSSGRSARGPRRTQHAGAARQPAIGSRAVALGECIRRRCSSLDRRRHSRIDLVVPSKRVPLAQTSWQRSGRT
jgi:hypothetical protein